MFPKWDTAWGTRDRIGSVAAHLKIKFAARPMHVCEYSTSCVVRSSFSAALSDLCDIGTRDTKPRFLQDTSLQKPTRRKGAASSQSDTR